MPDFIDDNGNWGYVKSGYRMSNTHGADYTTAELHKSEFEAIANEIIDSKLSQVMKTLETAIPQAIEEYGAKVWDRLINSLDSVLKTDIHSQVNVGISGIKDVFYGEKCQEYITNSVYKQLKTELNKIKGISIK